ncbi:hypothetical protein VTK56DRAFT_573 [Thermocarpiscus australiensis]
MNQIESHARQSQRAFIRRVELFGDHSDAAMAAARARQAHLVEEASAHVSHRHAILKFSCSNAPSKPLAL